MSTMNPYESPKFETDDCVSTADGPEIWNPNAAANWCLFFSPAFGAYLHARNAERLGRHDEAKSNQIWFYGSLVFLAASILSVFVPMFDDAPFGLIGLVILLTWYFTVAKKQIVYVKETFGTSYFKRSLWQPLLISFGCLLGVLAIVFVISIVAEITRELPGE